LELPLELEPELPLDAEPMFGHGRPFGVPDFCFGACGGVDFWLGVWVLVDVEAEAGVLVELAASALLVVLASCVVVGEAAAPAIPAAAPPVASAPATMVAPSILEMVIGGEPPGSVGDAPTIVEALTKCRSWGCVGVL
jgi:hypothetical protein